MNFLAHLLLSGDNPEITVGNFMGDFVKGRITTDFTPGIVAGLRLHRGIDSYVQTHPVFSRSRYRLSAYYGLYRGVMIDLFYDHFLSLDWHMYSDVPLDHYLRKVRGVVECYRGWLPERLQVLLPVIFDQLLPSYSSVDGIANALSRMSRRVQRVNPLAGGEVELIRNYEGLRDDSRIVLIDTIRHCTGTR